MRAVPGDKPGTRFLKLESGMDALSKAMANLTRGQFEQTKVLRSIQESLQATNLRTVQREGTRQGPVGHRPPPANQGQTGYRPRPSFPPRDGRPTRDSKNPRGQDSRPRKPYYQARQLELVESEYSELADSEDEEAEYFGTGAEVQEHPKV